MMNATETLGIALLWRSGHPATLPCGINPGLALQARARRACQVNWFVVTFSGLPEGARADVAVLRTPTPAVGGRRVSAEHREGNKSLVWLTHDIPGGGDPFAWPARCVLHHRLKAGHDFWSWCGTDPGTDLAAGWALQFVVAADAPCRVEIKLGGR